MNVTQVGAMVQYSFQIIDKSIACTILWQLHSGQVNSLQLLLLYSS
uniref:Uncharacterized protein n=1 Tax=Arundo donax TaxID=35708 RepID=A0A0A9FKV7_ARUDO